MQLTLYVYEVPLKSKVITSSVVLILHGQSQPLKCLHCVDPTRSTRTPKIQVVPKLQDSTRVTENIHAGETRGLNKYIGP